MLISHKYKFIFIKTTKTAGTSLEVELSQLMGKHDVVTPIIPAEENHEPRNFASILGLRKKFYNHMPAVEIQQKVGLPIFNKYFKFCVEREPVDKCISHYSMLKNSANHNKKNSDLTWSAYIKRRRFPLDHSKYVDYAGDLLLNRILSFERLDDEILDISQSLGFPFKKIRSHAKSGFREDIHVTDQQREIIYQAFAPSLRYTKYVL